MKSSRLQCDAKNPFVRGVKRAAFIAVAATLTGVSLAVVTDLVTGDLPDLQRMCHAAELLVFGGETLAAYSAMLTSNIATASATKINTFAACTVFATAAWALNSVDGSRTKEQEVSASPPPTITAIRSIPDKSLRVARL